MMGDISWVRGNCSNSDSELVSGVCTNSCQGVVDFSPTLSTAQVKICSNIVNAPNQDLSVLRSRSGVMGTGDISVFLWFPMLKENQAMYYKPCIKSKC